MNKQDVLRIIEEEKEKNSSNNWKLFGILCAIGILLIIMILVIPAIIIYTVF